jgi:DNA-binding NarL/FixJ family response regulator
VGVYLLYGAQLRPAASKANGILCNAADSLIVPVMTTADVETPTSRILIVDDHPLFREGLHQMIDRESGWTVCGEAADTNEAMRLVRETKPDLVIMDISLGSQSGIELIKDLKADDTDLQVLVVSMHDESLYAERSLRAGAMGYVMKHEPPKTVMKAIRRVLSGEMYLSERTATTMVQKFMHRGDEPLESSISQLSDREIEVFRLLGCGKGSRQIAKELSLTVPTISSFRSRIKEKLGLKDSSELMLKAIHWVQEQANK